MFNVYIWMRIEPRAFFVQPRLYHSAEYGSTLIHLSVPIHELCNGDQKLFESVLRQGGKSQKVIDILESPLGRGEVAGSPEEYEEVPVALVVAMAGPVRF